MSRPSALIAAYHVPRPDIDSSSRRLHFFIRFLIEAGWDVTVAVANPSDLDSRSRDLREAGVEVHRLVRDDAADLLGARQYDIVLIAFWHIAEGLIPQVRLHAPGARVIVDSMDLHFLRFARAAAVSESGGERFDAKWASDMARELEVYAAADRVLAVSAKETEVIDSFLGATGSAVTVPDCDDVPLSTVPRSERSGFVFVGNFEHAPNRDAVTWLTHAILPLVDREVLAAHPVTIIGNGMDASVGESVGSKSGTVRIVGWVPEVHPYIARSMASVLPLRFGAGTKRKLVQSMLIGTPAVSTTIGVEGFGIEAGGHALVADEPLAFARAMERLARDPELWQRIADDALDFARSDRGLEASRSALMAAISTTPPPTISEGTKTTGSAAKDSAKSAPTPDAGVARKSGTAEATAQEPEAGATDSRLQLEFDAQCRELLDRFVSRGSTALVVSAGIAEVKSQDDKLVWPFPRRWDGAWLAGPQALGETPSAHLEALRAVGAEVLVVPASTDWWLERYPGLMTDLASAFRELPAPESAGRAFDLVGSRRLPSGAVVAGGRPLISVVIPTRDRALLLQESLGSLVRQSVDRELFEVIVVDDGSVDETVAVCHEHAALLQLKVVSTPPSGIAAAKNRGLDEASGTLVLFFDDDDIAHPDLLFEHIRAHASHPAIEDAVLGWTGWSPLLRVSELMRYVTESGGHLFSYPTLVPAVPLDFTSFWGGRTSCKRELLSAQRFDKRFTFGSEDIELGYRLSQRGLTVWYWPEARQYMNRPLDVPGFVNRCVRQGRSQWQFSELHEDPQVTSWTGIADARELYRGDADLDATVQRIVELQVLLERGTTGVDVAVMRNELHAAYNHAFSAAKAKGIVDASLATVDPNAGQVEEKSAV